MSTKRAVILNQPAFVSDVSENAKHPGGKSAAQLYSADIARYQLLSEQEEKGLGRRIREAREKGSCDLLARNTLMEHNLRFVRSIAHRFRWSKIPIEDLIQEGNIGLMRAAEKYDEREGRFTSYAIHWITKNILKVINEKSSVIRIPANAHTRKRDIYNITTLFLREVGREPSSEELVAILDLTECQIRAALVVNNMATVSLDAEVSLGHQEKGGTHSIMESIADGETLGPSHIAEASQELKIAKERIENLLDIVTCKLGISERKGKIFMMFYGLDGSDEIRSFAYIGRRLGFSREYGRQVIAEIWMKVSRYGCDMDQQKLLQEINRVEALGKLVAAMP